jgi:methylmalonyl-CoA mutase
MRDAIEAALVDVQGMQVFLEPGAAAIEAADAVEGFGSIGGLGIDPVGALARTGEMDLLAGDGTARFSRPLPWLPSPATTLVADGRPFHEAGGSEGQELAGLIGALVFYLRAAEANGHRPADALPRIGLTLAADADLFLTIAKLRAARRLVARVAEACGIASVAGQLRLAVTTSERMLNRRGPWVNMLRTTAATAAAAIGGADAIGVLPFTWPLGEPDTFARRIARNTHHVLAEESGLVRAADPAGGAWSVEMLTEELAGTAWKIFQAWEAKGGIVAALKSGQIGDEIGILAAARNKAIATGHLALTGTSAFPQLGSDGVTAKPWPATPACTGALLPSVRLAAPFERLRDAADRASPPPRVFLATLGPAAEHGARAAWVANLLAAGGIAAVQGEGYTNSADAGRAFAESGTALACLCGTDAAYGELGETVAGVLRQAGATRVYLAGKPQDAAALKAAGVDAFWFAGADMTAILAEVHGAIGIG